MAEKEHKINMKLKCKINNVEYEIVQGATFSGEYNETLDSGSIIISDIPQIVDLSPYDRVKIWDLDSSFSKTFLIDSYSEEQLVLNVNIYKYKITLFSEIKALEKVQCPNISITQPLKNSNKRSVYFYLDKFVNAYSPKFKRRYDANRWTYAKRYTLDANLQTIFGDVFAPELTMTNPSLREVLSQLMVTKDCIPYVENFVIKALDITKRNGVFQINNSKHSYVFGSMSSESYATGLRREYSNAISQQSSAQMVEYLGFRNPNSGLLTFDNLQLETRFPIYKINKLTMCYYKTIKVKEAGTAVYIDKMFLCEQDITPLVLQNIVRNTLPKDWKDFSAESEVIITDTNVLAQYRLATLGYDIGSNIIGGWGEIYKYPNMLWWNKEKTYIENIINFMDRRYQFGTKYKFNFGYVINKKDEVYADAGWKNVIITPYVKPEDAENSVKLKSVFFKLDYNAMYNGATIVSKDNVRRDDIVTNDNSSAALSILETDGLFQKEKVNRLGNKTVTVTARFDSYADMVAHNNVLGAVYGDDIVIYHYDIAIYENCVDATFIGCYDYVLKNYFTTVWAKLRNYNLMPYSESVKRAEVDKYYLILSKDEAYYETSDIFANINDFSKLFSAFNKTEVLGIEKFNYPNKINTGYFTFTNDGGTYVYLSDLNSFVVGDSLCFNVRMYDNVSGGVYIDSNNFLEDEKDLGDYRGSLQKWHLNVVDREDAFIENVGCYVATSTNSNYFEGAMEKDVSRVDDIYRDVLMRLPQAKQSDLVRTNRIGRSFVINKDNKETLDMTFQFEPVVYGTGVVFSQWFMKLNDFLGVYNKHEEDVLLEDSMGVFSNFTVKYWTEKTVGGLPQAYMALSLSNLLNSQISDMDVVHLPTQRIIYTEETGDDRETEISLREIETITGTEIRINAVIKETLIRKILNSETRYSSITERVLTFTKVSTTDTSNVYYQYSHPIGATEAWYVGKYAERMNPYNMSPADITNSNGYSDGDAIWYLQPEINKKSYEKNMYVLYSTKQVKKDVVYNDINPIYLPEEYTITERLVSDTFSITTIDDIPAIEVNQGGVNPIGMNSVASIQYWYKDADGLLKFVFGADTQLFSLGAPRKFYIRLSILTRKDTRVFNDAGDIIGHIVNHATDLDVPYGSLQYYKPI